MDSLLSLLEKLHLVNKSIIQLNKNKRNYILDISYLDREENPLIATACSSCTIQIMSRQRLSTVSTLRGHSQTITKVQFAKSEDHIIFSSSLDGTVRCWDTRHSPEKAAQIFNTPPTLNAEILSMDTSHSDRLLCAGTEMVGKDSHLLFWDRRQTSLLGSYSESHQDDITQVCFQPGSDQYLASGSSDGLVCIFDLNETSEEDALQLTCNAVSFVSRIGWCGQQKTDYIYCVTNDGSFYVWNTTEGDACSTVCDVSTSVNGCVEYIVDCIPEMTAIDDKHSAVLLTGEYRGNLQLVSFSDQSPKRVVSLSPGHTAPVRCSYWDSKTKTLITGGEDSLVCLWSP
ncbi:WD repeat-containing protein 89 [Bulinus truncatus]|nr:WD repeat-containing protein 89 [Bulinus truncatus]